MSIPHTRTTFRHYAAIWRERQRQRNRPVTPSDWAFLQRDVLPLLGEVLVTQIVTDTGIVSRAIDRIRSERGNAKANRAHRLLRQLGQALMEDHLSPVNPCPSAPHRVITAPGMHLLTPDQRRLILWYSMRCDRLAPVGVLMETGMALDEVCGLDGTDILHCGTALRIRSSPASTRFPRIIPVSDAAHELLARTASKSRVPSDPLYENARGRRYIPTTLRARIAAMRSATGIEHLSHRVLVDDFIAHAVRRRIDPVQLKDYLGLKRPDRILAFWQSIPRLP